MTKNIKKLIASAGLLLAVILCGVFAKHNPEFISQHYSPLSRWLSTAMSGLWSVFPFSVGEVMILLALWGVAAFVIYCIVKRKSALMLIFNLALGASIVVTFCFFAWGLNYYALPLSNTLGINTTKYTEEQLFEAANYYTQRANEYASLARRDSSGSVEQDGYDEINQKVIEAYTALGEDYPFFKGRYYPAKPFTASILFISLDITGMYTPYSGEANFVTHTAELTAPFTVAHEFAHRLSVAPEGEANFCAFLACTKSDDVMLNYSAYYLAYVYCHNALPSDMRAQLRRGVGEQLAMDINDVNRHYERYEGKANEIGNKVNDTYLKVMNQESGVKSYGEVVDLLIAHYLENAGD